MAWQKIVVEHFGGPEAMVLQTQAALPEPGPGQIRVRVLRAGTGATDTLVRQGVYPGVKGRLPLTPGYDWVGVVDKLGAGVRQWAVGDRVADLSVTGAYTQYLCVEAGRVVPVPAGVDPAAAVCMLLPYTTAYQMLTRLRALAPGSTCLVHAGGGAVGTALLDVGRCLGLNMLATGSAAKRPLIERLGAQAIDYRREDFVARVHQLAPGGVAAVFDTLGARSWSRSRQCLAPGGLLVGFGALDLAQGRESVGRLMWGFVQLLALWKCWPDGRHYAFYNIEQRRRRHDDEFRQDVAMLLDLLAQGRLQPMVEAVLPLAEAAAAHQRIEAATVQGRLVLDCE